MWKLICPCGGYTVFNDYSNEIWDFLNRHGQHETNDKHFELVRVASML